MSRAPNLQTLTSIVAIDKKGAIGCQNALPWRLKSDLTFFRKTTTNNTVIMGRKTYDSIGSHLPNRKNVVLSHSYGLFDSTPDCQLVHSIEEALVEASDNPAHEIFVIGGAATYAQFAHLTDRYLVTIVDYEAQNADAFLAPEIMEDLRHWTGEEIASAPASAGRDDYSFKVMEFFAPDSKIRLEKRASLIANFLERGGKQVHRRSRSSRSPLTSSQVAFGF